MEQVEQVETSVLFVFCLMKSTFFLWRYGHGNVRDLSLSCGFSRNFCAEILSQPVKQPPHVFIQTGHKRYFVCSPTSTTSSGGHPATHPSIFGSHTCWEEESFMGSLLVIPLDKFVHAVRGVEDPVPPRLCVSFVFGNEHILQIAV